MAGRRPAPGLTNTRGPSRTRRAPGVSQPMAMRVFQWLVGPTITVPAPESAVLLPE